MNKDNAAAFLPLVQALADGKTIQFNDGTDSAPIWRNLEEPSFMRFSERHRIKPEPREFWLIHDCDVAPNHVDAHVRIYAYEQKPIPSHRASIRVREILD